MTFGQRIAEKRRERGLSQEALGKAGGSAADGLEKVCDYYTIAGIPTERGL